MAHTLAKNLILDRFVNKLLGYPLAALTTLLAPPIIAVLLANTIADNLNATVSHAMGPILEQINSLPQPINYILGELWNYFNVAILVSLRPSNCADI